MNNKTNTVSERKGFHTFDCCNTTFEVEQRYVFVK